MIQKLSDCRNSFLSIIYGKLSERNTCDKLVKKYLPNQLSAQCRVTDTSNGCITLTANNSGVFSLLRYQKATLLHQLRTEEKMYALRTINLMLEVPHLRPQNTIRNHTFKSMHISQKSCKEVHTAADQCHYAPLKAALNKLEQTLKEKISTELR